MATSVPRVPRSTVVLLVPLVALAAGCVGFGDAAEESKPAFDGYEDALEASQVSLGPVGGSPVEVELIQPGPEVAQPGTQPVLVLVHDAQAGEPVTDAKVGLEARMPAMGHGTGPEADPAHVGDGVYEGQTTWSMAGEWVLNLDVELTDGASASYSVDVSVGEHDEEPAQAPIDPYGSFGDVMAAPGTVYEGQLVSPVRDNLTVADEVQEADYEHSASLETEDRPLAWIEIQAELEDSSPVDELNVTLRDPEGDAAATLALTPDGSTGQAKIEDPAPGEWEVHVTGQGLGASYQVDLEVEYVHPHVDVKTLEPSDPTRRLPGERPFIFAVFEAFGPEPIQDADVNATYQAPGTDAVEASPTQEGHGQYTFTPDFEGQEDWTVEIGVTLPTGEVYRYEVDVTVDRE